MRILLVLLLLCGGAGVRADEHSRDTLDDVLRPFGRNVVPDPKVAGQREAFRLYVRTYFAGAADTLDTEMITRIMSHLEAHPEAAKTRLGAAEITSRIEPVEPDLARFARDLHAGYARLRNILTNPAANVGVWRKAKWDGAPAFDATTLRAFLAKATPAAIEVRPPAELPDAFATWLAEAGVARPARRAILNNVAHYAALTEHDPRGALRANDRRALLDVVGAFTAARARHLARLGVDFDARAAAVLRVDLGSAEGLRRRLDAFRAVTPKDAVVADWSLRPLSEAESPLRSLLAHDCATDSYFERAFDPAYYYFTRTESSGHAEGHITVVLGRAWHGLRRVRAAFVDKVQNVALADLPREIEALRQITARAGYELVIPEDLGDTNGISNGDQLREALNALPAYAESKVAYRRFRAERTKVKAGRAGFSRAFKKLRVRVVLPHADPAVARSIRVVDPSPQTRSNESIDVPRMFRDVVADKHGTADQRVRYLDAMDLAQSEHPPIDPEYAQLPERWLRDRDQPLAVRYHIASRLILGPNPGDVLDAFEPNELRTLLSNWAQSQRTRDKLRLTIWFMSPYLRGEHQILRAGAFPAALGEDARTYLVRALVSPPITDAMTDLVEMRRLPLHIDFVRIFVFLEAYLTARAEGSPATAELREAALEEARRLLPQYHAVLPPLSDHYNARVAELLARPDLRLDAAALEAFFDDLENQPEHIPRRLYWIAHSDRISTGAQGVLLSVNLAANYFEYPHTPWMALIFIFTLYGERKTRPARERADTRIDELRRIARRFPIARDLARALADAARRCNDGLTKN